MEAIQLNSGTILGAFVQYLITVGRVAHSLCSSYMVADKPIFLVFSPFYFILSYWITVLMSVEILTELCCPTIYKAGEEREEHRGHGWICFISANLSALQSILDDCTSTKLFFSFL